MTYGFTNLQPAVRVIIFYLCGRRAFRQIYRFSSTCFHLHAYPVHMKHFFTPRLRACLATILLLLPLLGRAQNLTQADFTAVVAPQYTSSGTATRLPVIFRATVSNLTPNTLYRYYNQAGIGTDLGTANSGAGNPLLITPGATPAATTYAYTSTISLATAGSYGSFTSSATGTFTGWFGFLNTGNARFTAGNVVYPTIVLAPDATPTVIEKRLALDQTMTVLALGTGTAATDATGFRGSSSATAKNLVAVYDNAAGTGRPLALTVVEAIAATGAAVASVPAYYSTAAGDWNTLIPNVLPTGVRRVEQRSVVDGTLVGCASDADGTWPSGANTVSPATGPTAVVLTATDAPLNTSACGTAATATITATPASLAAFSTTVGTPSATQTVTVGGTALTAGITATAPAGYEVSLSATTGFVASVTVAQAGGTAASTPVFVRLTGTTAGSFAGSVAVASPGATTQNVAVTGTVTTATIPVPTITSFTPTSGPVGTSVTVTGTDLAGATGATLNGLAVANFMGMGATSVMFDVPAGATSGPIAVTTPGGTATSSGSFTVAAPVAVPTITSLTPNAQVAGGPAPTLTIAGTGFTPASTVNFNGMSYAQTSSTATSLVVTIPASAVATAGNYAVSVTNTAGTSNINTFTVSNPSTAGAYENFETGTKTGYAVGTVALASGTWTFSDALLGTTFSDRFNGLKSARIRAGFIRMDFDKTTGAGTVVVNAALFGIDTGASFILEKSTDGGLTFTPVAGAPATLTATLTPYTFTVNQAGNVRFRITNTLATTVRISIDDISISNFTAPVVLVPTITSFTPTSAGPGATVTLTGTNLLGATAVRIGTFNVPSYTVVSATSITFVVPGGTGSISGPIAVTTPGGTATSATPFNVVSATLATQALPGLAVFPVPATDRLTVVLPSAAAATAALRDLTGRLVLAPASLAASRELRLPASLAAGVYLLEVRQGSVTAVRRVEKN